MGLVIELHKEGQVINSFVSKGEYRCHKIQYDGKDADVMIIVSSETILMVYNLLKLGRTTTTTNKAFACDFATFIDNEIIFSHEISTLWSYDLYTNKTKIFSTINRKFVSQQALLLPTKQVFIQDWYHLYLNPPILTISIRYSHISSIKINTDIHPGGQRWLMPLVPLNNFQVLHNGYQQVLEYLIPSLAKMVSSYIEF
jgi:hypothetical protein